MKKQGYYSSGEFAKMAHITLRTVRYYDKYNLLKPSLVTESGARFYTDRDFAKLQQILLLKYLGFSLDDIKEMIIDDTDYHFMLNSLNIQLHLIQDRIEQMLLMEQAIQETAQAIQSKQSIDWSQMLNLIHMTSVEKSLKLQYQNATNIISRINLHRLYSQNKQGWFPWIFEHMELSPDMRALEVGCGDGSLWLNNKEKLPNNIDIVLTDVSEGMLRDTRRAIGMNDPRFSFQLCNCEALPFQDNSFDLVIANHVLFYCEDIRQACQELQRVLRPGGRLICSTYGERHMKEITDLVQSYDSHIQLSAVKLYERFGRENGASYLNPFFHDVTFLNYEDSLFVKASEPLISYILSCHGNQNQILLPQYKEFRSFVDQTIKDGFHITKDSGIFIGIK